MRTLKILLAVASLLFVVAITGSASAKPIVYDISQKEAFTACGNDYKAGAEGHEGCVEPCGLHTCTIDCTTKGCTLSSEIVVRPGLPGRLSGLVVNTQQLQDSLPPPSLVTPVPAGNVAVPAKPVGVPTGPSI